MIDHWYTEQVRPRLHGPSTLVRFCDDFVMCFMHKADAERVLLVLAKRLGKFGLQLHPDKTRLVDFRPQRSAVSRIDVADDLQLPRVYPRMGQIAEGQCGGAAADSERSTCALAQGDQSTMQADAALADPRAAPTTMPGAEGALCLLWHHRQLQTLGLLHHQVHTALAEVVVAPVVEELCAVGTVYADAGTLRLAAAPDRAPLRAG